MVAQLTYDQTPAVAYAGMISEQFSQRQIDSFLAEDAIIGGYAVERGTDGENQVLVLTTAVDLYGVAVASYQDKETLPGAQITFDIKDSLPVMYRGRIWVESSGAVAVGDEVTPGTGANAGKWASGSNLLADVRAFARSVAGGADELLLIELSGPQGAVA